MALDLALVARAGSGVLLALTGLAILWVGGRSPQNRALGIMILVWGLQFIGFNILLETVGSVTTRPGLIWAEITSWPLTLAGVWLIVLWAREDGPRARWPVAAVAVLVALQFAISLNNVFGPNQRFVSIVPGPDVIAVPIRALLDFPSANPLAWCAAYAGTRAAVRGTADGRDVTLALGLATFAIYSLATGIVYPSSTRIGDAISIALVIGLLLCCALPWIVASARGAGRAAMLVAYVLLGAALLGLIVPFIANTPPDQVNTDPTGMRGVVRTFAWAALVYGILRHDLLGIGLRPKTVNKGVLAAGALAALFIVAQIAQNFLSAEFGLLTGGIVAGAFLFAAAPFQRAMERVTSGTPDRAPAVVSAKNEEIYRGALRVALRDRKLTREEEVHLHRVAEGLGIGAGRAHELLMEVERESEAAAARASS